MLATIERLEILNMSEDLANMILQSELMDEYRHSLYNLKKNKEAQTLISQFVKMKEKYEDVQRFGRYHPDYKSITFEIRNLKRQVDLNESVAAFRRAEQDLQTMLDELSIMVARSVSDHIKVPTGNQFFDSTSSCSGGCGSGGSCGCS